MHSIIITTHDELQALVIDAVNSCLDQHTPSLSTIKINEIISRKELCKRLDITEPTAIRWEKKGKIPSLRIGSNVRYNWPMVIEVLENKKEAKR